jgi:acid phosphatase
MLDKALLDRGWTAAVEQQGRPFRALPPAIVMDLDETILDNSPFEARRVIGGGQSFDALWQAWVNEADAAALPGAVEFTKYARSRGVTVFYVTNRNADQKKATRANLERDGFPLEKADTLYCVNDRPEWGSDKSTRRAEIAKRFRILLLFGDDLKDFMPGSAGGVDQRRELAGPYSDYWGTKWIILPNAIYGSWDTALFASLSDPTDQQKRDALLQILQEMAQPPSARSKSKP